MLLIRTFEEALLQRHDHGFQLLSSGQEAVAVGLCAALQPGDPLLASGRSIGAALARGVEPRRVMAELLGKATGPCGGRGGRGHLAQPSAGFFGAHAVVGGNLSVAAGVALALQLGGGADVVACIFGDGACGGGALHETLNLAALWRLPLLLVCDNNGYSVSTPRSEALAPKRLADLALAFGVPGRTVDGMDVLAVESAAVAFATLARSGGGPAFLECVSQRFASHSTAARETRSAAELLAARASCPILRLQQRLEAEGILSVERRAELEREVRSRVEEALRFADASPYPDPSALVHDGL
ncbi:MAG TPA: thiamine pyrophosphate-dependent dehydrogenase E1 component subunit alpha [Casimicrobiaceae bacterium]|nr:thiamine pyrophosphate-dependent dehydrogenase E1 component subunit alpha [Casimicrobiaceae bacterium]